MIPPETDTQKRSIYDFLAGGGEMGSRIRAYDWAASSLGDPAHWTQALKTTVRLLLSTGHPMFLWWGPELIQFYNDSYRRSIGAERHPSALGQPGRECWAEIWDIIGPQIKQVMAGGGHTWNENQLVPITRHGRREDVYWTYSYGPIDEPSAANGIGGVLVVCTETTGQVMAEQRLKAAEARWRSLFLQAPGFMAILRGPDHIFEFANARYSELVKGREIIGKPYREALPELENHGFLALLDEVYRTGEARSANASPLLLTKKNSGQQTRYLDFVYQPIRDEKNQVNGILVEGYDVTDRVAASEALRTEHERKDEFLAMLAHELRNPLAPIRNASELLSRNTVIDPSTRAIGDLLTRQVAQLTRLVDDLLDVSRITRDLITLRKAPVELSHAINLAVESIRPHLHVKQHEIEIRVDWREPLYVEADCARLVQAITNVLSNATKYSEPEGEIGVILRKEANTAAIEVLDSGAGISPEILPHVFELFWQDKRTLDRSQGGLGIGLSVVKRLIEMHGGDVVAASRGDGQGSKFTIYLPLIDAPNSTADDPGSPQSHSSRVLVVDDNADAADSLAQLLRLAGHLSLAVYSAEQVFECVDEFRADIILLDIGLPEMDGYEVARRMRARGYGSLLIAVTGYGQASDIRQALDAGFDAHITKPVSFDELQRLFQKPISPVPPAMG